MIKKMMSLVLAFSLLVGSASLPAFAAEQTTTDQGLISVSGNGTIIAKPDIAYLQVGYEAKNKEALAAQTEAKTKMAAILKLIKAQGIKDADIKTVNVSLYKTADYVKEVKNEYYVATNTVEITVRDIDNVGSFIDLAVKGGSNQLGSVRFVIEDQEKYHLEAIKLAIKNASTKANTIAQVIEVKIGKPSKVTENSYSGGIIYREAANFAKASADVATPVEVGTVTITADVNVEYKY